MPGKIDASLNDKLKSVEWGEYRIGQLFTSSNGDFDIQKKHINGQGDYVITSGLADNGILGKSNIPARLFDQSTITIDMFGNVFYRQFRYKMVTHARVFSLTPIISITDRQGLFLVNSLKYLRKEFSYNNMCSWEKIKSKYIKLPIKNNHIDFDFMEKFMAELESERLKRLSKYLLSNKLDNKLSEQEKNSINAFNSIKWTKYKMSDLFDKVKTKKLFYKAKDLPSEPLDDFVLPCLTSSFNNQGLNYYVPKEGATILRNVITIPQNSDVYRAYYQSSEFTVLSDAYAIKWKYDAKLVSKNQYLFMVMCINKVTDLPIYSYKNKLGGWNVVKEKYILLPQRNGEIDLEYMEVFIAAIKKLAVKSVVEFIDREIKDTQ